MRNNFISRQPWVSGDAGISVFDSPGTMVTHNTIVTAGTYPHAIEYRFPDTQNVLIRNNLTDAAIASRDNATAIVDGNRTDATPSMFVAPAAGDLHLLRSAAAALDAGVISDVLTDDWDGDPRPAGRRPDVAADEVD